MAHRVGVHAASGVADGEFHVSPGPGSRPFGVILGQVRQAGAERHGATLRHGVAGVDGQAEQHLLDHAGCGHNGGQAGRRIEPYFDLFAGAHLQQATYACDHGIQVGLSGRGGAAAAEHEQFPGEPHGTPRDCLYLLRVSLQDGIASGGLGHACGITHDGLERGSEMVTGGTREPAQAFHPLGFAAPGLGLLAFSFNPVAFGDIPHDR
jgi:hypothetical protein